MIAKSENLNDDNISRYGIQSESSSKKKVVVARHEIEELALYMS
jgi:hypothetical protein